ncbi:hypothetical protein B0J13DRAFT_624448 [Dactylonectria estremocensis]|uniref:Uncharacterized protein n=1 Tax=Dactylonectria estremocensis TaxID=1079267 RepID=A0A9P9EM97_9HYPO|nr:hypothetical protein B0J13DRAFT_624448 [Dactylonectria estremocensis]
MIIHYIVLLGSLLTKFQPARAFFPTQWKQKRAGNGGISHEGMTKFAFKDSAYLYFSAIATISSKMRAACNEIQQANIDIDDIQCVAHLHCDGESFAATQAAMKKLKNDAIDALLFDRSNVATARKNVGAVLHRV